VVIPRIVVAAPASGAGKTTVAVGLMAALRRAGHTVAGFKVGPDYIDPGFHSVATGRPGRNLDAMLSGEERVAPLFAHGAAGADIAVVEGVMGLYDGALGTEGFSSTAHVAKLLQAPVVLVVDASAAGRSVGAVVQGFVAYDTGVRIVGVILNKVGTDRHEAEARAGVAPTGVPVLGVLRRDTRLTVPSRHLGLVPADEQRAQAEAAVDAAAELVRAGVDLEDFVAAARAASPLETEAWDPSAEVTPAEEGRPRPARTSRASTRCTTRCRRGRPRCTSVAASRRCMPRRCPTTSDCARRWRTLSPMGSR
jgi:cobyrinic acid a,c-diamide synthase